jgi:hypothetical protein
MPMDAYKTLTIVDCRGKDCLKKIKSTADTKRNFIAIVNQPDELDEICDQLGCKTKRPERLYRWGIHALSEVLEPEDYAALLQIYEKYPVYLIEQLQLTRNRPPHCQPYLLYCEVRGIISDHPSLEDAGSSLLDYLDAFKRARIFPLAGIYRFRNGRWQRVRKLTNDVEASKN